MIIFCWTASSPAQRLIHSIHLIYSSVEGELFRDLQADPNRFRNVLCTQLWRGLEGVGVQGACQGHAGGQGGREGGEVPGGEDERAEAYLGPPLQQRLLWQPRSGFQRLQPFHWPACRVSCAQGEKSSIAARLKPFKHQWVQTFEHRI